MSYSPAPSLPFDDQAGDHPGSSSKRPRIEYALLPHEILDSVCYSPVFLELALCLPQSDWVPLSAKYLNAFPSQPDLKVPVFIEPAGPMFLLKSISYTKFIRKYCNAQNLPESIPEWAEIVEVDNSLSPGLSSTSEQEGPTFMIDLRDVTPEFLAPYFDGQIKNCLAERCNFILYASERSLLRRFCLENPSMLERPQGQSDSLRGIDYFSIEYQGFEPLVRDGLYAAITERHSLVYENARLKSREHRLKTFFSKMAHLCNSSGVGKTRSCMELARIRRTIMVNCNGAVPGCSSPDHFFTHIFMYIVPPETAPRAEFLQSSIYVGMMRILIRAAIKGAFPDGKYSTFEDLCYELDGRQIADNGWAHYIRSTVLPLSIVQGIQDLVNTTSPSNGPYRPFDFENFPLSAFLEDVGMPDIPNGSTPEDWLRVQCGGDHANPALIFAFDEAHAWKDATIYTSGFVKTDRNRYIFDPKIKYDYYRAIRAVFRWFEFGWHCFAITISTSSSFEKFLLNPDNEPSARELNQGIFKPVVLTSTFDVFNTNASSITGETYKGHWHLYFSSLERLYSCGECGRPLFVVYAANILKSCTFNPSIQGNDIRLHTIQDLPFTEDHFNVFLMKATGGAQSTFERGFDRQLLNRHNILMAFLGFSVHIDRFPASIDLVELVYHNMMFLFHFDEKLAQQLNNRNQANAARASQEVDKLLQMHTYMSAGYLSEGFANAIVSYNVVRYLDVVFAGLQNFSSNTSRLFNEHESSELYTRLAALASVILNGFTPCLRNLFLAVPFPIFLRNYCGEAHANKFFEGGRNKIFKRAVVAFNHFIQWGQKLKGGEIYDALAKCVSRGAALLCHTNQDVTDIVVPLTFEELSDSDVESGDDGKFTGDLSFVSIQVKNIAKLSTTQQSARNLALKHNPATIFQTDGHPPFVSIIHNLAGDGISVYVEQPPTLVLFGTQPGCFGSEVTHKSVGLINYARSNPDFEGDPSLKSVTNSYLLNDAVDALPPKKLEELLIHSIFP